MTKRFSGPRGSNVPFWRWSQSSLAPNPLPPIYFVAKASSNSKGFASARSRSTQRIFQKYPPLIFRFSLFDVGISQNLPFPFFHILHFFHMHIFQNAGHPLGL